MSFSYYEVYTSCQRAFSGMNFPHGADEDAAYSITWLELYNLKGIDLFCSFIEEFNNQIDFKIDISNIKKIDLKNKSSLMTGPGLIDYIVSKFILNNIKEYNLINCYDPIFLLPMLSKYSKKNIYTKVLHGQEIFCLISNGQVSLNKKFLINKKNTNIKIVLSNDTYDFETLDINFELNDAEKKLSIGLNPNQKSWDKVTELAFQSFVPESEESRSKGAGGGDAND